MSFSAPDPACTVSKPILLVYGCGGHGRSVAAIARQSGYQHLVFLDEKAKSGEVILSHPVVRPGAWTSDRPAVGIPASGNAEVRLSQMAWFRDRRIPMVSIVDPSARIGPETVIGEAAFIGAGVYIGPGVQIGDGCILNTGAIIEHDCRVGDLTHIAPHATLSGYTRIGSCCLVGVGASVIDRVTLTDRVTVGAGGTVIRDLTSAGVYVGCPVRPVDADTL